MAKFVVIITQNTPLTAIGVKVLIAVAVSLMDALHIEFAEACWRDFLVLLFAVELLIYIYLDPV